MLADGSMLFVRAPDLGKRQDEFERNTAAEKVRFLGGADNANQKW